MGHAVSEVAEEVVVHHLQTALPAMVLQYPGVMVGLEEVLIEAAGSL